jgi:ferrochelatase
MTSSAHAPQARPAAATERSATIGVLLAQLGTPAAPTAAALRPYLRQFLTDPRVVDLHPLRWWPILYGIVLTLRPKRSARLYRNIWQDEGSPLMIHSNRQRDLLQEQLGDSFKVALGMRYGEPSIDAAMRQLRAQGIDRILIFPMFPQFSCATTGSIYDAVYRAAQGNANPWRFEPRRHMPALRIVPPYYEHPAYIDSLRDLVIETVAASPEPPARYLFTFHGIPRRYIEEGDPYRGQCEETARLLAASLDLDADRWLVSFQSRFGKEPWLEPYTEEEFVRLGSEGVRSLLVSCPGFTADCLETLDELGREGAQLFGQSGGQKLLLAPCLNAHPSWIEAMARITREQAAGWA